MLYTADFETTTTPEDCRVWAWAVCEIGDFQNKQYGNSIDSFILWCEENSPVTVYFHNLKFDGQFIISYLLQNDYEFTLNRKIKPNQFTALIGEKNEFYSIKICFWEEGKEKGQVTIYDSLKLLPFSVDAVAKGFDLPIRKLELDYHVSRETNHELTNEEKDYISNDVEIVARALKILFDEKLTKMTTASNAMNEFKNIFGKKRFEKIFPPPAYDADIRQSYKGAFTYLNPRFREKDIGKGIVLDVNSLYPSVMYYRPLPYGEGIFFEGKYKEDKDFPLYVQMIKCQFVVKEGMLPTIQIKHTLSFVETEYLTSSNDEQVTLCLTSVDLELLLTHYAVYDLEYISGWKFRASDKMFRGYIDKWNGIKVKATKEGNKPMRTLAKLMLNSLYGKFAAKPIRKRRIPELDEEGVVRYRLGDPETTTPIYIPVGSFITAWARYTTITAAQACYDRFIYADTDSLHLVGLEEPKGVEIDDTKLGAWKHESTFSKARFLRQKSYIEEIDGKLKITCAGMPKGCYPFVTWDNFHTGNEFSGKLKQKVVKGGTVLVESPHKLRE